MKKLALLIYLPVLLMSGELKTALLKAKRTNKPVMVYVKAEMCQYCDKMKDETLSDSSVQENMEGFIFVKTDKTSRDAKKYLPATRYTPTVYFISPKFKVVNTVKGYLPKEDFNLWIDDSKQKLGMNKKKPKKAHHVSSTKSDRWMYDMASAMDYASQTGKQIMVYLDKSNSKWSKKMRKKTLTNNRIIRALDNFVWVKLQKGGAEARAYGLNAKYAPTVFFMRADRSSLAKAEGYFTPGEFIQWIDYAKAQI